MYVGLTEAQQQEMELLNKSEYVSLARLEQRIKYRQRQRLYSLRAMEKRGKELAQAGFNRANMEAKLSELEQEGTDSDD